MFKSGVYLIISFFIFFPIFLFSQDRETEGLEEKANILFRKAVELNNDGQLVESLDTMLAYLKIQQTLYGEMDSALVRAYNSLGVLYHNLGNDEKSFENYQLAEKNYKLRKTINGSTLGRLFINIGNAYRTKLDYLNALNYFSQALDLFQKQEPLDNNDISKAYYGIAEIKFLLNEVEESMEILKSYYSQTDIENKILYTELLAIIYENNKNYVEAERYFQNAINIIKENYGETDFELATEYLNYADFLSLNQNFEKGLEVLDKAYSIISLYQSNKGSTLATYYEYKGILFERKSIMTPNIMAFRQQRIANLREALRWYNKSLNALFTGTGEASIDKLTVSNCLSFNDCMSLLKNMADTHFELATLDKEANPNILSNSLKSSLDYYKVIGQLLQRARQEISSDASKVQLAQLEYQTFTKTIQAANMAYELSRDDQYLELAFANSEQIKSSAIFDQISNNMAQDNSLIPDSLIDLENKLNSTISFYNEKLFEEQESAEQDSSVIQDFNTKIFEASRQRDELNRFMEEKYPDYYDLKYSKSALNIKDIQKYIDKKDAIIEYVLYESDTTQELFTFLITSDHKKLLHQAITPKMDESMQYMFNFMTTPNYIFTRNEDSQEFCIAANNMYRLLIEPISNEIKNKNLVIIPDGKLNYIAFDGLLKTLPDTSEFIDFSKLDYLVRDYNVNYANSANILMKYQNRKRNMRNRILAFAPKYESEKFELSNAEYTLLPLPGVQKEVDAISKMAKTTVYRGHDASEENFRKLSSEFSILHLAMHAYINDSLPAFSRLAFSPEPGEEDIQKDGWLNTADIYNLDLKNVRLSVLSACNTGTGRMQRGEGLMSLARGFLYAGCPSIVVSLWEVEDNAGTQIMTSFYKNLERGKTKDAALRAAKLEYLENANSRLAHPHYWMSFKSIGDNSPVYNSNDIYFFALLIVLSLLFAIDQGIRIRKARRKRQAS